MELQFPQFEVKRAFLPHRLFRGGHAQTLAGNCLPGRSVSSLPSWKHFVEFPDGDVAVLHENRPRDWGETDRTAVLVHGLAGTSQSPYMRRVADKLVANGVRVFRMDLRACGAGAGMARLPYHPGRSEDGLWAMEFVAELCPRSPLSYVGFSLGANLGLKMAGEFRNRLPENLHQCIAINPPIDLEQAAIALERFFTRIYNARFVKCLLRQVEGSRKLIRRSSLLQQGKRFRRIRQFDDCYTRAVWGFGSLSEFYADGSAAQWLDKIAIPTIVLAAEDDPIVPYQIFQTTPRSTQVQLHLTKSGGHLGFVSRRGVDTDRRWMEWRIVDWITAGEPRTASRKAA